MGRRRIDRAPGALPRQNPLFNYSDREALFILGGMLVGFPEWKRLVQEGGVPLASERLFDRASECIRAEKTLREYREKARARAFARRARLRSEAEEG